MIKVFKYQLGVVDEQMVRIPIGAEFLHLAVQNKILCLWAKVDPSAEKTERLIFIHGTGHEMDPRARKHLGSFFLSGRDLVFHAFIN